ncbi:hypothetical protein [Bradyrhizobium manausense]|uniref:hypothetical protein n=1 Tax=Bradyrhizobium manausense TaxID=989370 RepID=UPI001BA88E94|nr:hypothetical protein [Bradyrhizobium manausense]MBR0722529.1 hypothetical protein [Bradyrhizobium manausense]
MRKPVALSIREQRVVAIILIKRRLAVIEDMQQQLAAYLPVPQESATARTLEPLRDGGRLRLRDRLPAT